MPENYLHLVRDVVDALGRAENNQRLQINEIQCQLLKQKLQETVTSLISRVDKDSLPPEKQALFEQRCRGAALLELYRIVKHAEAIIHGCSTQDWLKAAIKLANSFEAFVDIFFKIDWCTAVVGIVFSNTLTSEVQHVGDNINGFGEAECALKMEEICSLLQQPASQDRDSLRRRLTEMQEDTGARNNQEIVAYLLKLVSTDPANMEQTTVDLLPTIERENLRHLRSLGKGGFGEVAEVEWLGQKVAQKVFRGVDPRSFRVEANILAGLRHPNIVQIFGVCTGGRQCSIVMEMMHGDLRAAIAALDRGTSTSHQREQSFELPVALDIMLQMAEAMQYLHRKKITHRDLKSANVLINPAKIPEIAEAGYVKVKVADFGTSKMLYATSTFSPQTVTGTTGWMAPEVAFKPEKDSRTMKHYPFKSDVYSYAITCSEILSGLTPYEGIPRGTLEEMVRAGERPPLPISLPTSLLSLIECCWDGDVGRRPSFSTICTQLRHLKGIYLITDCVGCGQTFSMPPFSIGPEDVDTEIETDDGMHDINTLLNMLHDLQRQLQEKDQTLHEHTPEDVDTEIAADDGTQDIDTVFNRLDDLQRQLQEKDQILHERTPEDVNTEIETDDGMEDIDTVFNRLDDLQRQLQEKDQTLHEQTAMLMEIGQTLRERDARIKMLLARQASFCVVQ